MRKILVCLLMVGAIFTGVSFVNAPEPVSTTIEPEPLTVQPLRATVSLTETPIKIAEEVAVVHEVPTPEPETVLTEEEIDLIALLTMAEAEGECEEGQRLVIDVVLNRVDDPHFPNTVYGVVYQKNQFSGMYGERIKRCYVMDELVELVRDELESRTNHEVVFFRTNHYHSYGVPMFQVGAHYFSSYD